MKKTAMAWLAMCLSATLLIACGGGGDSGRSDTTAGVGSGGTGSFSGGPITGFGSIVVNGIHFDQTLAEVTDADGQPRTSADLQLGMTVELDGSSVSTSAGREVASALHIRISSTLLGPVDAVGTNDLRVMGQTVRVGPDTHFDAGLSGGLGNLAAGDVVAVYGFYDAVADAYVATRIERRQGATHYIVEGVVKGLNQATSYCAIGAQTLLYSGQTPPPGLANGRVARALIDATSPPSGSNWAVQSMVLPAPLVSDRDEATLDGLVTSIDAGSSARVFRVNGIAVDAGTAECAACAVVHLGDHVQVRGKLVQAVLTARAITLANQGP